jgi:succinate dehydrogenase hydrophobic anchor subunit
MKLLDLVKLIDFFRDRLRAVIYVSYGVLAFLVILDIVAVDKTHAHTWMEKYIPGWWSLFGFVACVLIIILSKWYGHLGIMTREDYYD